MNWLLYYIIYSCLMNSMTPIMLCVVRRSQWSGAKAFVKLIKPRKESSRERGSDRDKEVGKERERAKSVPDIPLPAPPHILPPESYSPSPKRTGSDSQDGSHAHSNHSNHTTSPSIGPQSPAVTPISRGKHTEVHKVPSLTHLDMNNQERCL